MQITKSLILCHRREDVWQALNNPDILKQCIPGCEELDASQENRYIAVVALKIGPMSVRFKGDVVLSDIDAPNGYTISGQGRGGVAGYAKGRAEISLSDHSAGTVLNYEVDAELGGRIAQLGSRLIDSATEHFSNKFFTNLDLALAGKLMPGDQKEFNSTAGVEKNLPATGIIAQHSNNRDWLLPFFTGLTCGALIGALAIIVYFETG